MYRVIVLSKRDIPSGVIYDGDVIFSWVWGQKSLAEQVLHKLRAMSIDIQVGDMMFFPNAHPDHRLCEVHAHEVCRRLGWSAC